MDCKYLLSESGCKVGWGHDSFASWCPESELSHVLENRFSYRDRSPMVFVWLEGRWGQEGENQVTQIERIKDDGNKKERTLREKWPRRQASSFEGQGEGGIGGSWSLYWEFLFWRQGLMWARLLLKLLWLRLA